MNVIATTSEALLQETASLDLKRSFNPASNGEWCELLKDLVAMANSGGGRIIIGLSDDGTPSGICSRNCRSIDPAVFVDKIHSYTGVHFAGVSTRSESQAGVEVTVFVVEDAPVPLVFDKAGNYQPTEGKQRNAFNQGTLYVRHGAKSEPATSADIREILDRHLKRAREALLVNLRQVVEAPAGSVVSIAPRAVSTNDFSAHPVRLVEDPAAAPAAMLDPNITHPHRQKEVIAKVNERLAGKTHVTSADVLAIRRIHRLEANRSLCYQPRFGSCQYSDLFVEWIISHIQADPNFLRDVKHRFHELTVAHNAATRRRRRSTRMSTYGQPSSAFSS